MTSFQVLPAIDLRGGRVVRLQRGDFMRETAFSDDPVAVAHAFREAGARWVHAVDLDGARTGVPANGPAIRKIVAAMGPAVSVEIAGGLRTADSVDRAFDLGAARVVVGTTALADPGFARGLVRRHGAERIAVSLDVRDGKAVGQGWVDGAEGMSVDLALARLLAVGVVWFEVTAIQRDGMLGGPDLALLREVRSDARARIIASGGIASADDIRATQALGCAGAIVGRALYDGTLKLGEALAAVWPGVVAPLDPRV
ncbi:MAG: 1-(5-phosphoribosyl)-5-[(5-phosphoribosylamino)methylideneamino] imidazole-4-carboxamide isomerase [Chloroflexota bacterium]